MSAGRTPGAALRCRAGDRAGCGQHQNVLYQATLPRQAGSRGSRATPRCPAVPTAAFATFCQLVPGPGSLPRRSCFWKPEKPWRCPRHLPVLLSAQHLQLSPAVSLLTIPGQIVWRSASGATRSWRQRCASKSRGGVCARGEDTGAAQLGWKGAGRQEGPWVHPRSSEPSSVSGVLRAERRGCRSHRSHPESPKGPAVFLVQRYEFRPAQGTVFIFIPVPPGLWWHHRSLLRTGAPAGFPFLLSPSSLVGSVSHLLAGSPGLSAIREPCSPSLLPPQRAVGKGPGGRNEQRGAVGARGEGGELP